ncbi:helix-turn-helix transcriptional regulator [Microbacterium sp.]|uniref:helix-turn-helix transcriptional regulator n=1 Tax=Microbacterium sp. TaxID=51671 RepID=UPI002601AE9E|nr:helix-turn-helix transcriptional regulator [Microbacterium sp.]
MTTAWLNAVSVRPRISDAHGIVTELTAALLEQRIETAPHVVAQLAKRLNNDTRTVCEVAAALTPSQRRGHSALPRVLPATRAMAGLFEPLELSDDERRLLVIAALCSVDDVEVLAQAAEITVETLAMGANGVHLKISRGRFAFVDPRLGEWMLRTAHVEESARAHDRLSRAHLARDEPVLADWHRARGAQLRIPAVVPTLLTEARSLVNRGHPLWGCRVAAEAAEHSGAGEGEQAYLIAGASSVGAGYVNDGVEWLRALFPRGRRESRAQALANVFIAETCLHGTVPVIDPAEHRPRGEDVAHWRRWGRAAGVAAALCAERAAHSAMRLWLAELREADARTGANGTLRDPVVTLCWMLTGETSLAAPCGTGPFSGGVIAALRHALDGDIDEGLRIIARARAGLVSEPDPLLVGLENSPLVEAYLVVTEALLYFWHGDITTARSALAAALVTLPVGLPFAGMGSTLAHRLDIAVDGAPGVLARAVAATLPRGIRVDRLVDHGLVAYLAGRNSKAARMLTLWRDRGAPEHPLAVPGFDEIGPLDERANVEPPEQTTARALRHRIRQLPDAAWQREHAAIARAGRALRSPFERARVEAMLGSVSVIRGERAAGRRHLDIAQSLFEDAGAEAWAAAVAERLRRVDVREAAETGAVVVTQEPATTPDPHHASRSAWAPLLTARELDVAMRVVEGLPNREIAELLGITVRTIEVHTGRIFAKLGVRNRVQLTVLAHRTARHL